MDEVIDIDFEVGLDIMGIRVGVVTGTAGVDSDGVVCWLSLDGTNAFGPAKLSKPVQHHKRSACFDDCFLIAVADAIESDYADEIAHKLNDWADSAKVPEYDANEAAS